MIVYADRSRVCPADEVRERLSSARARLARRRVLAHEAVVELLVDLGEIEAGLADAAAPERDDETRLTRALRSAMEGVGRLLHATWTGAARRVPVLAAAAAERLAAVESETPPDAVRIVVPEGFAYYALRPECYVEAACRFLAEVDPRRVACIGLRSIGTSLSAVVAGTLAERGVEVTSWTVRPRGHPFARGLALSPALSRLLREAAGAAHFAVVDEGPGLSGSSFAGTVRELRALGVPADRIVLFPSWDADPERLVSEEARREWTRCRRFVVPFEAVWIESGRLASAFSRGDLADLSAGRWRRWLYHGPDEHPAVLARHERRKYLSLPARGASREPLLLKFCGLGPYGRAARARAMRLWRHGFAPRPRALRHGFLACEFVRGRPLRAHEAGARLFERVAEYLAFLAAHEETADPVPCDALWHMLETNVGEGLGPEWRLALHRFDRVRPSIGAARTVAIDGRLLPHEFLEVDGVYLKTDGVDHHQDHCFPGHQDVAWDVAGTIVEFDLGPKAEADFVSRCVQRLSDPRLAERLGFYRAAYLAYRLGYAALAVDTAPSPDRERFALLRERYARRLRRELTAG